MNKNFLSVILFGALMVATTGTFVSCKDYDDDISNLQEQIDSQKSDLSSKVAAVESSISSLQAAQSGLESAIAAAKDEAEKAALAAQVKAIETASAELATVKAELQAAIKLNSDDVEAVKAAVAKANDDMSKAVGRIQTLEAFKTTTETALAKLGDADVALTEKIEALNTELVALGGRLTAVEAQVAALEAYKISNDAAVAGNTAAIDQLIADLNALEDGQLTDAMIQKIAEQVTEVVGAKLDIISAALNKKVTHVSLFVTALDYGNTDLNLVSAEAVRTWTFGDKLAGTPVSFTEGDKETFEDSFIVRVSPTNATLDKSMIKLINSQLNDLNGLLVVENIEAYKDLVTTTRGVSANGLWKVSVKLIDDYSTDAYKAAAATYKTDGVTVDKRILYAVMIGDSVKDERQVVSEYGVTLGSAAKTVYRTLNFNVDETPVAEIKNRWGNTGNSYSEDGTLVSYVERKWNTDDKYKPWAAPIFADAATPANINVLSADDDIRNGRAAYSVKAGKAFTVNYTEAIAPNIRGFYVTLDGDCAVESAPSEINAWKSYGVKGLNTVTSESSLELTIPEDVNAEGDYIGFRVYAVNYDGSLVDPDGKAFYVYVGETDKNMANLTLTIDSKIVVPLTMTVASKADAFSTANWSRAKGGKYDLVIMEGENDVTADFNYTNFIFMNAKNQTVALLNNGNLNTTDAITSVASVKMAAVAASTMKDGVTYTATITAKNGTSGIVAIATIKFTKTLPAFPTSVYPYTNILMNGNLKIYPVFKNNQAEFDMNNVWHGISAGAANSGYSNLIFSEIHAADVAATIGYVPVSNTISVPSSLVDPAQKTFGTKFPMAINYDYGTISKAYNAKTRVWEVVNHNPAYGQNFTAEFGNYVYDCTFAWKTAPKVTYPGAKGQPSYIALGDMKITDWYNAAVDLTKMTTDGSKEHKYMKAVSLNFLTGATYGEKDEYYAFAGYAKYNATTKVYDVATDIKDATHIKMMSQSEASQGNDVPTKIQLVFTDNFDFEVTKVMDTPFTMAFKQ